MLQPGGLSNGHSTSPERQMQPHYKADCFTTLMADGGMKTTVAHDYGTSEEDKEEADDFDDCVGDHDDAAAAADDDTDDEDDARVLVTVRVAPILVVMQNKQIPEQAEES